MEIFPVISIDEGIVALDSKVKGGLFCRCVLKEAFSPQEEKGKKR
jgi:hypothetical protein